MTSSDITAVVHGTGFITGIVLYAMLALMTLRARTESVAARSQGLHQAVSSLGDNIPLVAALLGIVWNAGGLVIYGGRDIGASPPSPFFAALAFAALGFLPAVVVHAAASQVRRAGWLTGAAYALSLAGAAMQIFAAVTRGVAPYRPALLMLTVGYGVIVAVLAFAMRGQPGGRGPLAVAALAVFAVMALHLSHHENASQSVAIELLGHHASLPLVLVILYQDYRFAFADLFLKRALALVALVSVALATYLLIAVPYVLPRLAADPTDPRGTAALVALWVAVALLYPVMRNAQARFVDRVVLRRVDAARLRGDATTRLASLDTIDSVLDAACAMLAPALSAHTVRWSIATSDHDAPSEPAFDDQRLHTRFRVNTAESPSFCIQVGVLAGGRRMLSGDMALVEVVAEAAARRIDVLRVAQERHERTLREQDLQRLTTESEFRALQAQLNPHFLFNALTTIGYLLHESPQRALDTLLKLTGLLRAVLRRSTGEFVTLGEEMDIVESYLAIERARFEDRLIVRTDVDVELRGLRVPPLLLQPLVENAVKHGISQLRQGGTISISGSLEEEAPDGKRYLRFAVVDTGAGTSPAAMSRRKATGTGLANLESRLTHYYGTAASLSVESTEGRGTRAELVIPLASPVSYSPIARERRPIVAAK